MTVDGNGSGERLTLETWPDTRVAPRTFFGAAPCSDIAQLDASVAMLGVPYDFGGGVVPGARYAPNALRDARSYSVGGWGIAAGTSDGSSPPGYYDVDEDRQCLAGVTFADCGDIPILPGDVERNFWRITRAVRSILARGSLLVAVGGDHSITGPVVRGFDSMLALDVVHFDAHHDYLEHAQGGRWANGSPIRRVSEFPWVRNITQIGIRTATDRTPLDDSRARGNRIVTADQFRRMGPEAAMAVVPESNALYVTIDIDVMDPSLCPGTASPELGGLGYLEMRAALRALAGRGRIVGIDLVEVCPPRDLTGVTVKTGAQLLIDLLTAIHDNGHMPAGHARTRSAAASARTAT